MLVGFSLAVAVVALVLTGASYTYAAPVDKVDFANAQYVITAFENDKPKTIKVTIASVAYTFTDSNTSDSRINLKTDGNAGFLCSQTTDTAGINLEGSPKPLPGGGNYYSGYIVLSYSGDTNKKCTEGNAQEFLSPTTISAIYNVPGTEKTAPVEKKTPVEKIAPVGEFAIQNPLKAGTVPEILDTVARFLFNIALAFVIIMVLWGGFQILTAAGRPEQIDKGKKTLLYAVVGTVVILVAGGIADLVGNILGGESGPSPTEIQAPSETNRGSLPSGGGGQQGTPSKPPLLPE